MSWLYRQSTGEIIDHAGKTLAVGYSGAGQGKNQSWMENVKNVGPIPKGAYRMNPPVDTVTHGPLVIALTAHPENRMYGRSGFLIHGDSILEPGTASQGCIILPREARAALWNSGDHDLGVVT